MIEIYDEIFQKNLLLTQAYCELQLRNPDNNPATALRTFNPVYNEQKLFSYQEISYSECDYTSVNWNIDPLDQVLSLYMEVFEKQLIHKNNIIRSDNTNEKFEGKILIPEIDMTVIDGASEAISNGFVDINDCPPIDTWFYKTLKNTNWIFFAWIPQQFVNLADKAITVNCVDCLFLLWYEDWLLREKVSSIQF